MEHLEGILRLTDDELGAVVRNGKFRSRDEIESVYQLIDIAKDIYCIWEYEDGEDDGYSRDGDYSMRYRRMYDGTSYARGRGRNAKRDSMGRYAKEYRGYSRGGHEEYIENLRELMEDAPDEETRQSIHRMIQQMENR